MPVYASTPGFTGQRQHPRALVLIVGIHAVAIAAVMTAKMDLPTRIFEPPITIIPIHNPPEPPPVDPPKTEERQQAPQSTPHAPIKTVQTPTFDPPEINTGQISIAPTGPVIGPEIGSIGPVTIDPPVRVSARFITPERLIKPPYPADKQRLDEEASLRLKLTIDERGRVTAVEPVGKVDRSFLEAARKHLIANWRYKPATEDGHPVPSSTVITLSFRLA